MGVTLQDIAQQLDVSTSTVSRSLRNDKSLNPETRARVNEMAQRLGYKNGGRRPGRPPNNKAKAKSQGIGLLLRPSGRAGIRDDSNLTKMMAGIMAVTDANRLHLHVHTIHNEEQNLAKDASVTPPMIKDGLCHAIITRGHLDESEVAFLAKRVPVISMGRVYYALPVDAVVADNTQGVRSLVTHLVELGHRRLAWVNPLYASFMESRQSGFMQGCISHRLDLGQQYFFGPEIFSKHISASTYNVIHDRDAVLAAVKAGVTAFVCGNDAIALAVMEVLETAGHRVPEEVSVTGFDAWLDLQQPIRITTVNPHFYEIGEAAAQLAILRMAKPALQPYVLSVRCEIVIGETAAPAPH